MSKVGRFFRTAFLLMMLVSVVAGFYFWFTTAALTIFLIAIGVGFLFWLFLGIIGMSKGNINVLSMIFGLDRIKEGVAQQYFDMADKGQFLLKIHEKPKVPKLSKILTRTFSPIIMAFGILNNIIDSLNLDMKYLFTVDPVAPTIEGFLLYVSAAVISCIFSYLWVIDDGDWMYFKKDSNESVKVSRIIMTYIRGYIGITMFFSGVMLFGAYLIENPGKWMDFAWMMIFSFQIIAGVIFPITLLYLLVFHKFFVRRIRKNLFKVTRVKAELHIQVTKIKSEDELIEPLPTKDPKKWQTKSILKKPPPEDDYDTDMEDLPY